MADHDLSTLDRLLAPRSIALVGASADPKKFGGRPLAALKRWGYRGDLYVVNPHRDEIQGVPCTPDVRELAEGLDLAVVMLPAEAVLDTLEGCAERRFGAAAVFSGGFSETGGEGEERQRRLRELVDESGMRVLGPNIPGFINLRADCACTSNAFALREEMFPGRISFVLQSGALAGIIADRAFARGIGINAIVCTGNEGDVDAAEALRWVAADPHTDAVGLFLEGVGRGRRLVEAIEEVRAKGVGVAALKTGRSERARKIVASHTALLVGSNEAFDAVCESLGVARVHDYDGLLETTHLLAVAPKVGRRIAVVGSSGGMSTLLADEAAARGIDLPELAPETAAKIAEITPAWTAASNPVDISSAILVEPERMAAALEALGADPQVDTVVVVIGDHPPELSERLASIFADATARVDVPIVVQWSAGSLSLPGIRAAERRGLAVLTEAERAMEALAGAHRAVGRPRPRPAPVAVPPIDGARSLSEHETKLLLEQNGVRIPRGYVLADPDEAGTAVNRLGGIAVLKADCVGTVHKTEAGAIRVGVTPGEANSVAATVLKAARGAFGGERVRGLLVEEMVECVAEFVVSAHADEHAGTLVTVGAGGELVEVLRDTASRLAPVDVDEALEMVDSLKSAALLDGFRGRPRGDRRALAEVVARVSAIGAAWSERLEVLELNPVAVLPEGVVVLDAVVELA